MALPPRYGTKATRRNVVSTDERLRRWDGVDVAGDQVGSPDGSFPRSARPIPGSALPPRREARSLAGDVRALRSDAAGRPARASSSPSPRNGSLRSIPVDELGEYSARAARGG